MRIVLQNGSAQKVAGYGESMVDFLYSGGGVQGEGGGDGASRGPHYDSVGVDVTVAPGGGDPAFPDGCITLTRVGGRSAEQAAAAAAAAAVPFGRAAPAAATPAAQRLFGTSEACPVSLLAARGVALPCGGRAGPKVASVVVPRLPGGASLLTRRRCDMRSFPGAWVFPGGHMDAGETPAEAATREVREETNLTLADGSLRLVGLWESVFPTTAEGCLLAGKVHGHCLVFFYTGEVAGGGGGVGGVDLLPPSLRLQEEETEDAVAVPDAAWDAIVGGDDNGGDPAAQAEAGGGPLVFAGVRGPVAASSLRGIYPNSSKEPAGVAQGHLFIVDVVRARSAAGDGGPEGAAGLRSHI